MNKPPKGSRHHNTTEDNLQKIWDVVKNALLDEFGDELQYPERVDIGQTLVGMGCQVLGGVLQDMESDYEIPEPKLQDDAALDYFVCNVAERAVREFRVENKRIMEAHRLLTEGN